MNIADPTTTENNKHPTKIPADLLCPALNENGLADIVVLNVFNNAPNKLDFVVCELLSLILDIDRLLLEDDDEDDDVSHNNDTS